MPPAFAAKAAFFIAAEGTGEIEFVVGVAPDHAGGRMKERADVDLGFAPERSCFPLAPVPV